MGVEYIDLNVQPVRYAELMIGGYSLLLWVNWIYK